MEVVDKIFKAYDIRGLYPTEINETVARLLGRAFAVYLKPEKVILGYDARLSGPSLTQAISEGLREQGVNVLQLGFSSTDYFYYACGDTGLPGMMITASHNPKDYNGVKLVKKMPYLLSGDEGIADLKELIKSEAFGEPSGDGAGREEPLDLKERFLSHVLALIDRDVIQPLKIVADAANGAAGVFAEQAYERLPIELTKLYFEPDGNFPNHGLDPLLAENRRELRAKVLALKADAGFAFDGDGDRFFTLDDRGEFVPGDFLTALLAESYARRFPGAKIIYDVRASWAVRDLVSAAGGTALMHRVGHAFIKKRLTDEGAVFGGEVSGHYYFQEFFNADSGLIPSLKLLELLSLRGQKLSEILAPLREKYFISGEINLTVADQQRAIDQVKSKYPDGKVYNMDGLSVEYPTWHFNLRSSNTEPLLRLNLEALSLDLLETKKQELLTLIQ